MLRRFSRPAGLTLIELVVVIAILAALAGLVVPQVAGVSRSADMATSAKCQQDVANQLQLHFVLNKRFPQYMDSLLESDGTSPTGVYGPEDAAGAPTTNADLQATGLPCSSPKIYADLDFADLDNGATSGDGIDDYLRSFTRSGFDYVMDHSRAVANSNNSAITQRQINVGASIKVAQVRSGSAAAKAIYPVTAGVPPGNMKLVALAFGPSNSAVSKTTLQAPIYPGCDGKYYGRYIAVFACYPSGKRAMLAGVFDAYGRYLDYTIQQYNESLPEGSRQG